MEAMEAILSRRSIRKYTDQPVAKELVNELIQAAMAAPSANNQQPWHFVIIKDRQTLDQIPKFHPYSTMLKQAQLAIAVCGDSVIQPAFWIQDCSAACENILLAAHSKGLGAVWLAVYPRQDRIDGLRQLLNLPETIIPLSLVSLGYPASNKPLENRYDTAKIHYERW
jgi:nitroreductase